MSISEYFITELNNNNKTPYNCLRINYWKSVSDPILLSHLFLVLYKEMSLRQTHNFIPVHNKWQDDNKNETQIYYDTLVKMEIIE